MATKNKKSNISFFNSHLISVISTSLVLFLFGLILIIGFLGRELSHYVKENITVSVILEDGVSESKATKIIRNLEKQPYVKSTEYISKEQALADMQNALGEDPETFLGFNPFRASIEVKLNPEYANPESLSMIEQQISYETHIMEVFHREDIMHVVNQNIRRLGFILIVLFVILILISFVLINNTVRLIIYSKRFLIYTMRLVGATPGFIRWPFIRYNIITGFIAGVLAIIMLSGALYYLTIEYLGFENILNSDIMLIIYAIVLFAGIILSVVAAYFAVNRYLRMARGKLYYI